MKPGFFFGYRRSEKNPGFISFPGFILPPRNAGTPNPV